MMIKQPEPVFLVGFNSPLISTRTAWEDFAIEVGTLSEALMLSNAHRKGCTEDSYLPISPL